MTDGKEIYAYFCAGIVILLMILVVIALILSISPFFR